MPMQFRLVDGEWGTELDQAIRIGAKSVEIVCPFIKKQQVKRFLATPSAMRVLTRFNLDDFSVGVSDTDALRMLLKHGAQVRGVKNLHAKMYVIGSTSVVTSANLTGAALSGNHEFGFVSTDLSIQKDCRRYFDKLWERAGPNLTAGRIDTWDQKLELHRTSGAPRKKSRGLGDEGVDVGFSEDPVDVENFQPDVNQAFVKFFGKGNSRAELSVPVLDEIRRSGCHWACAYPKGKRPRQVQDGAVMFFARLTKNGNDARIFGRAVALPHVPGRDDATSEEIELRSWKAKWPHYVRVHHAEFVAGTLSNGVSLNEMMNSLRANAFQSTQRNAHEGGNGNIDPRRAYRQQPSVELSGQGITWAIAKLDAAFQRHGRIANADLTSLDWPNLTLHGIGRELSHDGRRLLRALVEVIHDPSVNIEAPRTYPSYSDIIRRMGIAPRPGRQAGVQFEVEGGIALNDWLRNSQPRLPALTGLVVRSGAPRQPGPRYFRDNGYEPTELEWWRAQMRWAADFDWSPLLSG